MQDIDLIEGLQAAGFNVFVFDDTNETEQPKELDRYRYGWEATGGHQMWSPIYEDFGLCYSDFVTEMQSMKKAGCDLAKLKWRGVHNLKEAAAIIAGNSIYD